MKRSEFLALAAGAALAPAGLAAGKEAEKHRRPNVVVLFIDDLGYGDIGAFGCPDIPTPHIDSLAADGTRCVNGYTTCAVCTPSRTAMLTGVYQQRLGVYGLEQRGHPIPDEHPIIAEFMRDAGYVTGMVGRWDIGAEHQGPLDRGFMEVGRRSFISSDDERRSRPKGPTYLQEDGVYWTERQGDEMAEFVERHQHEPFFLYFSPLAIHYPVEEAPQKYLDRVPATITDKMRRYLAGTLIAADDAIGKLLAAIKKHGLEDDTLIVFTGDNGGYTRDGARNAPFRGGKNTVWEGGVHEPYIVKWPGKVPAGKTYRGLISILDVYATAAAVAGREAPAKCDGKNFLPYLTGKTSGDVHDALFWRYNYDAIRRGKWRLMRKSTRSPWQLYDIENDPGERHNLAAKHPDIVGDLAARYDTWDSTLPKPPRSPRNRTGGRFPRGIGWATPENP